MSDISDKRLIEEYLPIKAISAEASREKSVRKGHISTLHLWWARRPLVACRAAVYGALVPASRFVPNNGTDAQKKSLGRANAAKFVTELCKYPGNPRYIEEARKHILEAHAQRLTGELGTPVTVEDIVEGRQPKPKVLDMFAGGGAIPLEALRLGCEAYALDLNPVAHIIELCTLVYPQKYGKPDPNARGMTGPPGPDGKPTWGGLANEVRYWGEWVLERVKAEIGDLYPPIPDPDAPTVRQELRQTQQSLPGEDFHRAGQQKLAVEQPAGYLTPVAYLWTRTVHCKNPSCGATVPLVRQTWLCKKPKRYVALKMIAPPGGKQVRFEVVESDTEKGLGFDPAAFSKGGNATCPFCGTVADSTYVKAEGCAGRMGQQMMAVVCTRPGKQGKVYLSVEDASSTGKMPVPPEEEIQKRIEELCSRTGLSVPSESLPRRSSNPEDTRGTLGIGVQPYGLWTFGHLFTPRQMLCLLTFAAAVREAQKNMVEQAPSMSERPSSTVVEQASSLSSLSSTGNLPELQDDERSKAVATYLGVLVDRQADYNSSLARWHVTRELIAGTFGRQALPMVWDFAELAPFGGASGSPEGGLDWIVGVAEAQAEIEQAGVVLRGSATSLPWPSGFFDAVITDPPYYDNVPYADISDFFYVWLKRTIGHLYPEHFATELTPKKSEAVADAVRHGGSKERARQAYEDMMAQALAEAHRVLKPGGNLTVVYAHKTTLGWATLVDALRKAGFAVTEAWPLDTEMGSRLRSMDSSALASSIFIVARKRAGSTGVLPVQSSVGSYEDEVQPELQQIVRERVDSLWEMGVSGADLVIAAVGAGLRAFTRFARVEYSNGEEVPAEKFLAEVEGVVLETILEKIFRMDSRGVGTVDGPTRFYVLWRYAYGSATLDAGEAIVFTYGQPVELDGPNGLSSGSRALVEKKKGTYRLLDYKERGDNDRLGLPDNGMPAPLVDVLHRVLWLMENNPRMLSDFLDQAMPNRERLRLVAQALAGAGLSGKSGDDAGRLVSTTSSEHSALGKLLANWRSLIEQNTLFGSGGN